MTSSPIWKPASQPSAASNPPVPHALTKTLLHSPFDRVCKEPPPEISGRRFCFVCLCFTAGVPASHQCQQRPLRGSAPPAAHAGRLGYNLTSMFFTPASSRLLTARFTPAPCSPTGSASPARNSRGRSLGTRSQKSRVVQPQDAAEHAVIGVQGKDKGTTLVGAVAVHLHRVTVEPVVGRAALQPLVRTPEMKVWPPVCCGSASHGTRPAPGRWFWPAAPALWAGSRCP